MSMLPLGAGGVCRSDRREIIVVEGGSQTETIC